MSIAWAKGKYWIYQPKELEEDESLNNVDAAWYYVYNMPMKRGKEFVHGGWFEDTTMNVNMFYLEENDIIKIGRVRFKIAELFVEYQDDYKIDKPADIERL